MSCEGNRHRFFDQVGSPSLSADSLERIYQANKRPDDSKTKGLAAEAKTRALFARMQKMGIKPPTHAEDGLPRKSSQLGYAAVYDALQQAQDEEEEEKEEDEDEEIVAKSIQNRGELDEEGYDQEGYDADGYDKEGFNRYGYDQDGYDREGYNVWGLDSIGRDRDGYNKLGYDRNGRDRDGFDREGYDEEGYDRGGYDQNGYDREGNRHDFFEPDENGFYGDGRDQYGFDEDGFNHWGLDCNGYDKDGYDSHNFDRNGRNKDGYNRNGKDPQGYNRRGYQEQPDGSLRDREGFDRQGFDEDGYTSTGYDKNGRDKDGNRRDRRFTRGKSGKRLKANFCKSGWDQDGYDRWGFHNETGLTAPDEETGHQRNWLGWIYDPKEEVCYNPDNPNQKMAWSKEKNRAMYIKPAFNSRYRRGGYLTDDGLLTGRSEPRLAPTYEEMGHVYTPPDDEIDHHKRLSFEEFRKRRRFYASKEKLRHEYRRFYTNNLTTKEEQEQYLRDRWRKSKARVDAGGGLITAKGCLLRCPHCGQYMSPGKSHRCPNFNDRAVYVAVNGRVTADNWSGELLADPNIDDPQAALMYPDGYNIDTGYDQEGYDRQGYDFRGFNRDGYNKQGYDRLGYDKDGYDQQGYNRQGVDRKGEKKPATLESVASFLSDDDLLDNEDLADLYSRVATGLVGAPRSVYLEEGGGFGTDMRGKIKADPYPLGRNADPRSNLVVTRAGIHHELGHELFTDPEQWAQVLEIAKGKQEIEGLSPDAAQILPHLFNVVEDGRMERALSEEYAGVSEVLAASCRLEERWDGRVGAHVPMLDQVFGASLYRALPFYARPDQEKKAAMNPQAREIYEKFSPLIDQAVSGSSQDAFRSAVAMSTLLAEESGTRPPNPDAIKLPPLPPPPKGTKARTGNPKDESGQGRGRPKRGEEDESGQGRGRPKRDEEETSGQGHSKRAEDDESGQGKERSKRAQEEPSGQGQSKRAEEDESGQGKRSKRAQEEPSGQGQSKRAEDDESGQGKERSKRAEEEKGQPNASGQGHGRQGVATEDYVMDSQALEDVLNDVERESSTAIETGVKRRNTPVRVGQRLHQPLPSGRWTEQTYYNEQNNLANETVFLPQTRNPDRLRDLSKRAKEHNKVARLLAKQLEKVREQAAVRLNRQTSGKLDRRQLVNAYKGLDDVRTRTRKQDKTSFAVSIGVDQSSSMQKQIREKKLYDATMTLAKTLDQLEMAYEVRGFGSTSAQYKAMDEAKFNPSRGAVLADSTFGGTMMGPTAGLATQSLLARDESNRLFVSMTDGALHDHAETVVKMKQARENGIVTYGIYLGSDPTVSKMDEIYGRGNWTTINQLSDMPKKVGQRIASIFKALR